MKAYELELAADDRAMEIRNAFESHWDEMEDVPNG